VAIPAFLSKFQIPKMRIGIPDVRSGIRNFTDNWFSLRSYVWSSGLLLVLCVYLIHYFGFIDFGQVLSSNNNHVQENVVSERLPAAVLDISEHEDVPIQYGTPHDISGSPLHSDEAAHGTLPLNVKVPDYILEQKTEKISELFTESSFGDVPARTADGKTVFDAYKLNYIADAGAKGVISIVMVDYGLSEGTSKASLVGLPENVTFVISPYSNEFQKKIDMARAAQHEVWLDAPIQTEAFGVDDTGPVTMLSGFNNEQNTARLQRLLSLGFGYAGINFMNKPAFSDAEDGIKHIFDDIEAAGIGLVSADPDDKVSSFLASRRKKIPYIENSLWLDGGKSEMDFARSLKGLEQIALDKYVIVAYIPAQPSRFAQIKEWAAGLKSSSLQLVPLSAAIEHQ